MIFPNISAFSSLHGFRFLFAFVYIFPNNIIDIARQKRIIILDFCPPMQCEFGIVINRVNTFELTKPTKRNKQLSAKSIWWHVYVSSVDTEWIRTRNHLQHLNTFWCVSHQSHSMGKECHSTVKSYLSHLIGFSILVWISRNRITKLCAHLKVL